MTVPQAPAAHIAPSGGWWARFHRAQLFDYNGRARRFWLAVALAGAIAIGVSIVRMAAYPVVELWEIGGWLVVVSMAAAFPIQIPRSKHSISTGDIVNFLLLALYGAPAAVASAALEGLIGAVRSSRRVSSRVASTAAAAAGMGIAGALFGLTERSLVENGLPPAGAHLAALAVAAGCQFMLTTYALMRIVYLKRSLQLTLREWFEGSNWVGALSFVSAVLAGLLSLNARQFGNGAVAVGVLVVGLSLALLRSHFRLQIKEHDAQEARVTAAELEAQQNQRRFHGAFTHASIGMAIVSPGGVVLQANAALCGLLGYDERLVLQRAFTDLLHQGDAALLERHVGGVLDRREDTFSIELRCVSADRAETWVSLHCALFDDQAGAGAGLIYQLHDITSRRRAEGALHHIAYHDGLTDLANRNCLHERLAVAVQRSRTDPRFAFALMYLDLDRFKNVNDSLGHPAGDELLREVARRLGACVRPKDLVARLGGDEFCVLIEDGCRREDVAALGERLLASLAEPFVVCSTELRPMASIGVTYSDMGYREPDEILRDADVAMYRAKADGKGRVVVFDASLHEQLGHKLQLEADLRRAIVEKGLTLHYQPLVELETRRLVGFEALARWVHPTRGPISPAVFIELAEETGCIQALTSFAIDEAVRQLAEWRRDAPGRGDLMMHVNVSSRDLTDLELVPHVRAVLDRHALPPRLLTLEITESTLMQERETAFATVAQLCEAGVGIGIDDFGTGYSSLAYLSVLPFDCLKIDRSFVSGMEKSPQNMEIVRTVISMARSLNKGVVAEGIETPEQAALLAELGGIVGQGYLLARPMDSMAARRWLETKEAGGASEPAAPAGAFGSASAAVPAEAAVPAVAPATHEKTTGGELVAC